MNNFRDLSYLGLKQGTLLRGEALCGADPSDLEKLVRDHHLKTIVDLRSTMECAEAPDPEIPGVKHVHAPILPEKDGAPEEDPPVNINGVNLPDLKRSYRTLVSL